MMWADNPGGTAMLRSLMVAASLALAGCGVVMECQEPPRGKPPFMECWKNEDCVSGLCVGYVWPNLDAGAQGHAGYCDKGWVGSMCRSGDDCEVGLGCDECQCKEL
jgi:hypothetical protein